MKKLVYFIVGVLFFTQSCEQKKEAPKELALFSDRPGGSGSRPGCR